VSITESGLLIADPAVPCPLAIAGHKKAAARIAAATYVLPLEIFISQLS
jgi:hypothetical protein